jgi:hypothetical protein
VKALSVKQPWASLIMSGRKTLEIRGVAIKYRGPLAICSSQVPDKAAVARLDCTGPLGAFLGTVQVVGCRPFTNPLDQELALVGLDPARKLFAWELFDPQKLRIPPPIKGALGLFDLERHLADPEHYLKQLR